MQRHISIGAKVIVVLPTCNRYQVARVCGARRHVPQLSICEVSGVGSYKIPGWRDPRADALDFVHTLVRERSFGEIPAGEMQKKICGYLSSQRPSPQQLVLLGWGNREAAISLAWAVANRTSAILFSESGAFDERRVVWKEWIKRRVVGLCSAALVGGRPHADYMAELGMPRDRIFLGYDAVDNEYFSKGAEQSRKQKAESRNKYGVPENYFLASARFVGKKNLPGLLKAYAAYRRKAEMLKEWEGQKVGRWEGGKGQGENAEMLKAEMLKAEMLKRAEEPSASSPWHLVLLGDGPLRPELCRLISDLGLQDFVLLPGFKQYPDLPAYYGLANAFIHASTTEQWGLVVNEAMASGLPVLVSNRCGCAPDLVQEGVNGWTFDPYNTDQLADLMLQLSQAPKQRLEEMGAASRRIIQDWGVERFAAGLKAAVDKALEVGPKRASVFDRLLLRMLMMRRSG